jgi:hypothetical protein
MRIVIIIGAVGILALTGILVSLPPRVVQSAPPAGTLPADSTVAVQASDLNPYQESRTFNWTTLPCNFGGQACQIRFSAVPAGKRLIIENISGELVLSVGGDNLGSVRTVRLFRGNANSPSWHVPTVLQSTLLGASTHAVNSQVLAHFEAGQVPTVFVNTDSVNAGFNNELTISGHFVQVQ